jgi:hypothetical protein
MRSPCCLCVHVFVYPPPPPKSLEPELFSTYNFELDHKENTASSSSSVVSLLSLYVSVCVSLVLLLNNAPNC